MLLGDRRVGRRCHLRRPGRPGRATPRPLRGGHLRAGPRTAFDRTLESFYGVDVIPLLAEVRVPVWVVHGAGDRINPVSQARSVAAACPDAQLHVPERTGHLLTLTRADHVAELVIDATAVAGNGT